MDEQIQMLLGEDGAAVYRDVRQELVKGNASVARAASVGAALFSVHAAAWAERESRAAGKKVTARDYLKTVEIDSTASGSNLSGFAQAAMYKWRKSDFREFVKLVLEREPDTLKSFYRLDDGKNRLDVTASNIMHIQEGAHQHPLTVAQYLDLANNILCNIKAASIARRQKNLDCLTVAAHIGGNISDYAAIMFLYPNQRVILGTVMPKTESASAVWLKERGSHALHELSRGVASNPSSISSIQAQPIVVKRFQEIEKNKVHKSHEKSNLQQSFDECLQGQFSVLEDGRRLISLFESANESTFLHEMAHVFYDDMERLAPLDSEVSEDFAVVEAWAMWHEGAAKEYRGTPWEKEFAEHEAAILAAQAKGDVKEELSLRQAWRHERFARGFEAYIKEGEAPTSRLAAVFKKGRQLLCTVYHSFIGAGGRASAEVEIVMAKLVKVPEQRSSLEELYLVEIERQKKATHGIHNMIVERRTAIVLAESGCKMEEIARIIGKHSPIEYMKTAKNARTFAESIIREVQQGKAARGYGR